MDRNVDVAVARAFLTVVETGSVTQAAKQLNLSQGAISQQLRRLQEFTDQPLFVRAGRGIAPTPDGQRLLPAISQLVAANETLLAALRRPAFEGEIKFGVPYDIIGAFAPGILRRFAHEFPSIRVTLICKDSVVLLDEIGNGAIDVALTTEVGCGRQGETLRSDRLVWVGARNGVAHTQDPLQISLGADTCVFRSIAIAALKKARRNWNIVCEVSNMEPVRAMLEADLAIAPLLGRSIPDCLSIIEENSRLPKLPMLNINLYKARNLSLPASAFADHVRRSITASS